MILNFPQGMGADNWQDVILSGRCIQTEHAEARHTVEWTYHGDPVILVVDTDLRVIELDDATEPARVDMLQAALDKFGTGPEWSALHSQVISAAQSAVGVSLGSLTAGQRNALMALVLWDKRAIANDGTIRPLAQWVKRRP